MPGTVLVRRRALGDVVLLGAVTAAVDPPVTVMTDPRFVSLAARLRGVDQALPWDARPPPGRVIDLQRDLRTLRAYPFARKLRKHTLRRVAGLGRPLVTELYARACGVSALPPPWFAVDGPREALVLIPGASCAPKRWSPASFAAVGRRWTGPVWVIGGAGERALVELVAAAIPGAGALAEDGFDRTLDVLGGARVAVGGDTGLLHLAAACGARPVALFGPTDPRDGFFPYDGAVVSLALPCRPCARHRVEACRVGHHGCMGQPIDAVVAACASSS